MTDEQAQSWTPDGPLPEWDRRRWDESAWDGRDCAEGKKRQIMECWESADAHGYALAVQLRIVSNKTAKLDCSLLAVDMTYSVGEAFA